MINVVLIILIIALAIFLTNRRGLCFLQFLLVLVLVMVIMTAQKLFDYQIGISNNANVFYGAVPVILGLIYLRFGRKGLFETIWLGLVYEILWTFALYLSIHTPSVAGNETVSQAYLTVFSPSFLVAFASFGAFTLSSFVFLALMEQFKKEWIGTLQGFFVFALFILIFQAVDSFFFFTLVFRQNVIGVWQIILIGFLSKSVVGIILEPLVFAKVKT